MKKINNENIVSEQYKTSENLDIRIKLHEKYSTNKQGFNNWILSNYSISQGMKILELGCGTGIFWKDAKKILRKCEKVVFTDLSEGMLKTAKENIGVEENIFFEKADVQNLPYKDGEFDVVIANMMLYHVPNIEKALLEIKRVLKESGKFYSATFGVNGVASEVNKMLKINKKNESTFTLQNGALVLGKYFDEVKKLEYMDSLEITEKEDLVEYIASFEDFYEWNKFTKDELYEIISNYETDGKIKIKKEYGMFISSK